MIGKMASSRRLFTRIEAERMLPLVRAIVRDLVGNHRALADRLARHETLLAAAAGGIASRSAEAEIEALQAGLLGNLRELEQLGVVCRDPDRGVVEFPAGAVPLTWSLDDERVSEN